jgi:ribosomal protein L16 Arg81 hydroxylase
VYDAALYDEACASAMPLELSVPDDNGDAFLGAVLGRIPALNRSRFFTEYWNTKPLWVRPRGGAAASSAMRELLSLADIDALIAAHPEQMRNGLGLKFAMNGQVVGQHLGDGTVIDVDAAHQGFSRGATVIIHEIERLHPPIGAVAKALEAELGVFASANMYLTPPTKRAFDPHFDLEDTFIQQVSGSKTWRVWSPSVWPVPMPLRSQTEGKNAAPPRDAPCFTLTLEPGDVLYVPRGHSHVAVPTGLSADMVAMDERQQGSPSVHLTNTLHVQEFTVSCTGTVISIARKTIARHD